MTLTDKEVSDNQIDKTPEAYCKECNKVNKQWELKDDICNECLGLWDDLQEDDQDRDIINGDE